MNLALDPNNYDACPQYNAWLDDLYSSESGALNILGYQPNPSFVLFSMSRDTYEAAFSDFMQQREDAIREDIRNSYPSPIAYYFYRFETGYENELQRLHFLRDTWESVIDILHALAVAEVRHRNIPLADPLKFKDILTDSVARRLDNIGEICDQLVNAGLTAKISQLLTATTRDAMKYLNQSRNAFSHSAAQSDDQAKSWISECSAEVLEILGDLAGLADLQIVRYLGNIDATTLRCEVFRGHSSTKTILNIKITQQQMIEAIRHFQNGNMIAIIENDIFGLRPMIHFRTDASGHTTRICIFRKSRGESPNRRLEYEVVGEAIHHEENRASFASEITELRTLFGLGAE